MLMQLRQIVTALLMEHSYSTFLELLSTILKSGWMSGFMLQRYFKKELIFIVLFCEFLIL